MSSSDKGTLMVHLEDPGGAYWITVQDGRFSKVGSGAGNLSLDLDPGIYTVQASIRQQTWEKIVRIKTGETNTVVVPVIEISSSVPLAQTLQHHEYHEAVAYRLSRNVHYHLGHGSNIFMLSRRFSGSDEKKRQPPVHPMLGLTLHDVSGRQIADLYTGSTSDLDPKIDPWATCNLEVDPGHYRLRMQLPTKVQVELPLYIGDSWQVQIFALQSPYGPHPDDLRANLVEASIYYTRFNSQNPAQSSAFDPYSHGTLEIYRLTELARESLLGSQPALKEETKAMLWEKFESPMLGIMGGHLLLQEREPDFGCLSKVVTNLRRLLGEHPDVEALALALGDNSYTFRTMPMLRKGWKQVLKASLKRPEIVPPGSEAFDFSNHLWGEGIWLFTTVKPEEAALESTSVMRSLTGQVQRQAELTSYEKAAYDQVRMMQSSQPQQESFSFNISDVQMSEPPKMDSATAEQLVENLGVPLGKVEYLLQRATEKAQLYETTRTRMKAGLKRTSQLEKVISEIRNAAIQAKIDPSPTIAQLIEENSEGSRIAAIGIIEINPNKQFFPFLVDAIRNPSSPFEQYHTLVAAWTMVDQLTSEQKTQLRTAVEKERGILPGQGIKPGTDRWVISDMILKRTE